MRSMVTSSDILYIYKDWFEKKDAEKEVQPLKCLWRGKKRKYQVHPGSHQEGTADLAGPETPNPPQTKKQKQKHGG